MKRRLARARRRRPPLARRPKSLGSTHTAPDPFFIELFGCYQAVTCDAFIGGWQHAECG